MTNNKLGVISRQEISYDLFESILTKALVGTFNYWFMVDITSLDEVKHKYQKDFLEFRIAKLIWYDKITIRILDRDNEDVLLGEVNIRSIKNAFEKLLSEYPEVYLALINHNFDEGDADVFFQYAVMGEVKFG